MTTPIESAQKLGEDNVEIAMKTFGSLSTGIQTVASEIAAYNRMSYERGAAFLQDLAGAKSVGRALEIQTNYWKSSYEDFASEITRLGEIWAGIAQTATKPQDGQARRAKAQ
jgi:hypothetical protein